MLLYINLIIAVALAVAAFFYLLNPLKYKGRQKSLATFMVFCGVIIFNMLILFIGAAVTWLITNVFF